jgi:aspartyl protease family protein
MLNKSLRSSFALAFLLTTTAGLPTLRPAVNVATSFQLMSMTEIKGGQNGHYVVKAFINNQAISVLVDTGASAVALSAKDADQVGLNPELLTYDVPVATANGMVKAARVKLDEVEIDSVRLDNVDALVMPEGALNVTLLGMSFLSRLSSFTSEGGVLTLKN